MGQERVGQVDDWSSLVGRSRLRKGARGVASVPSSWPAPTHGQRRGQAMRTGRREQRRYGRGTMDGQSAEGCDSLQAFLLFHGAVACGEDAPRPAAVTPTRLSAVACINCPKRHHEVTACSQPWVPLAHNLGFRNASSIELASLTSSSSRWYPASLIRGNSGELMA